MAAAPQLQFEGPELVRTVSSQPPKGGDAVRAAAGACAGGATLLGVLGMVAWHAGWTGWLTWHSGFSAMHFNTAFLVALAGASLAASLNHKRTLAGGLALLVAAAAVVLGCNEVLDLHWGLNAALFPIGYAATRVAATRVAPNTGVALFAAGIGLALLTGRRRFSWCETAIGGLASVALALSTAALFGYCFAISPAYQWREYNAMALPTAVSIALLGVGLLLAAGQQRPQEETSGPPAGAVVLAIALVAASLLVWEALDWQRDKTSPGSILPEVMLALALAMSALAVLSFWLMQVARQQNRALQSSAGAVLAERERLHRAMDMLPAYVVLLSPDYHVPFANKFFEERFGKAKGRRCYEYLFQRETPCENCETFTVARTHAYHHWEWVGPDGRNYDIHDFPFTDYDGSPLIMEMGLDVTEQKAAEEKLRNLNRSLRAISECNQLLLHANSEPALVVGVCNILVKECGHALAWMGYPQPDEAKSVRVVAAAGVAQDYLEQGLVTWADEERGRGPTGTAIRTREAAVVEDAATDPKFAPWRERALEKGFHSTVSLPIDLGESMPAALSIYSREKGRFHEEELKLLTELAQDLGYGVRGRRSDCERERAQCELQRYAAELERSNAELQDFASIAAHDLQEPLRKVMAFGDRLREHCAEVDDGHLGPPARAPGSETRATQPRPMLDETGQDFLRRMQNAAARMSQLIESLLQYSRVTSRAQPFEKVDLTQVMIEVVADLELAIRNARAKVSFDVLPIVSADRTQMRQLLQNLVANGLKFQPQFALRSSPFAVSDAGLEARESDRRQRSTIPEPPFTNRESPIPKHDSPVTKHEHRPEVVVENAAVNGQCTLRVRDNGVGFDEAYLDRLFRPFQRLHGRNEFPGSGMGLAICRKIAQRHGGSITAHSRPGEGSVFEVTLPIASSEP